MYSHIQYILWWIADMLSIPENKSLIFPPLPELQRNPLPPPTENNIPFFYKRDRETAFLIEHEILRIQRLQLGMIDKARVILIIVIVMCQSQW